MNPSPKFSALITRELKVIPLKLFYYQTFWKLGIINIHDINIKKMGSSCLFTRQQALKMGYIYWFGVKNPNLFHTELSLESL